MARAPALTNNEALPEADKLEGVPHPRETTVLYGHQAAENIFAAALSSEKIHHAWLLSGTEGIGKATLSYRVARAALARPEDRDPFGGSLHIEANSPAYRQVTALSHPGLLVIRRGYDQKAKRFSSMISVDDVRRLRNFLSLSAELQGWRVVIVDSADELNVNAANALLKSLEEPPAKTIFLIISSAPGRLLPTIRSRCRSLALAPLGPDDLMKAVRGALEAAAKPPLSPSDFQALAPFAGGSPRRLLAMAEGGGLALQAKIAKVFEGLPILDLKAAHALADELQPAAQEQKFELFYDLLLSFLSRLVRAGAAQEGERSDVALSNRIMGDARLATFAQLWETLARDKAEADALNLDRKSLILDSLSKLEAAARS